MPQKIILKKSSIVSKIPTTTDLDYGEVALNYADGALYYKRSDNTVQNLLASSGGVNVWTGTAPPSSPTAYPLWWDSTYGTLKIYYNDGTSSQWVDASPGILGPQGDAGTLELSATTTVNPNVSPSVTNTGTASSAVLAFSIPRAATVDLGTTTTGLPGTSASVTNTGANGDAVLNFTVPRGATVALNATAVTTLLPTASPTVTDIDAGGDVSLRFGIPRAATLTLGTVTTGTPGTSAAITNTGTNGDAVLNFTIPRGATVALDATPVTVLNPNANPTVTDTDAGSDVALRLGIPRAAAVSVGTVTTGAAGSSAAVTNTGANGDVVLNFTIPRGDAGELTLAGVQTLTNKTISGASNTLTNIGNSSLTNSSVTVGSTAISLGASATTIAGLSSVTSTTFVGALTGNASTATTATTANNLNTANGYTVTSLLATSATGRVILQTDSGGSINMGRTDAAASSPYIDFNSGATTVDYDARIQSSGGNGTSGNGTLNILAGTLQWNSVSLVTLTASQTLTNKTISGASNTLSNIPLTAITSWPAGVDVTEVGYLDGVSSAIQTQIDNKASTGKAIAMAIVFG